MFVDRFIRMRMANATVADQGSTSRSFLGFPAIVAAKVVVQQLVQELAVT